MEKSVESLKQELEQMFDEMLRQIKLFKKKTYSPAFLRAYDSYRELLSGVSSCCADMGEEALTEFAEIIPEYAFQKIQKFSKRDQEKYALNFNLAMVVYVVPLFIHTRDPLCEKLAEMMVEKWNQKRWKSACQIMKKFLPALRDHGFLFPDIDPAGPGTDDTLRRSSI